MLWIMYALTSDMLLEFFKSKKIQKSSMCITPEKCFCSSAVDWICGRVVEFTCVFGNYAFRVTCNNVGALLALCDLISAIYCSSTTGWKPLWIALKFLSPKHICRVHCIFWWFGFGDEVTKGTIHLRRRQFVGGSKIGQITQQIVVKNCRQRGVRGQK